jgi:hypothetical protein
MTRRTNPGASLRTLDDAELGAVSGGHHHHHHHHCHERSEHEDDGGSAGSGGAGSGGAGSLLQSLLQGNMAPIIQFVIGNSNTVTAAVSQANLAP